MATASKPKLRTRSSKSKSKSSGASKPATKPTTTARKRGSTTAKTSSTRKRGSQQVKTTAKKSGTKTTAAKARTNSRPKSETPGVSVLGTHVPTANERTVEKHRKILERDREKRERIEQERSECIATIMDHVADAVEAGVSVSDTARFSGVSRQHLYKLANQNGSK